MRIKMYDSIELIEEELKNELIMVPKMVKDSKYRTLNDGLSGYPILKNKLLNFYLIGSLKALNTHNLKHNVLDCYRIINKKSKELIAFNDVFNIYKKITALNFVQIILNEKPIFNIDSTTHTVDYSIIYLFSTIFNDYFCSAIKYKPILDSKYKLQVYNFLIFKVSDGFTKPMDGPDYVFQSKNSKETQKIEDMVATLAIKSEDFIEFRKNLVFYETVDFSKVVFLVDTKYKKGIKGLDSYDSYIRTEVNKLSNDLNTKNIQTVYVDNLLNMFYGDNIYWNEEDVSKVLNKIN